MAVINVHGGHNPEGRVACGAKGILDESREDRIVKDKVIRGLRAKGHTVCYCCYIWSIAYICWIRIKRRRLI